MTDSAEATHKSVLLPVLFGSVAYLIGLWLVSLKAGLSSANAHAFAGLAWEHGVFSQLLAEALGTSILLPGLIILVMSCFKRYRATTSRRNAFMIWSTLFAVGNGASIWAILSQG
jgi:hypothetical protein